MGGGLYREMSRLSGFRVLGFLGLLGYLIPYLGLLPFVTSIIPQVHPSKTIDMFFDKTNLPKNTKKPHSPKTIHSSSLVGLGAHPLGYNLIPLLGVIMCCMEFYYLLTERVAPSPNREDFLVFLVILVVLDILYLTWDAGFHPEDSSSPSTCAFFSKNPRIPRTKNYHTKKGSAPTLSGGGYTFTGGDNAVYGILLPPNREGGAEPH